jgi:hypothetical protein
MTVRNPIALGAGTVSLASLEAAIKESGAVEIAAAPKAEAEITESATGNGVKEPSATKPVWVYLKFIAKEDKKASLKVEVGAVIVYEYEDTAVVALKQTQTASFLVPKAVKFTVTFSECEKLIPTYHTL